MRHKNILNGIWDFSFCGESKPSPGQICSGVQTVPGCFDLTEPYCGKRGYAIYTRKVHAGGKNLLEIDGAGLSGEVYWDSRLLGKIPFAYLAEQFVFDAGDFGEHQLSIILDNRHHAQFRPDFDFYGYGGIYGDVTLTALPEVHIHKLRITTEDYRKGELRIRAELSSAVDLEAELRFDTGFSIKDAFRKGQLECRVTLPEFRLWSVEHPELHTLTLSAGEDKITETFGIREFRTEGQSLKLNGETIKLYGVNRHESFPTTGAAVPPQQIAADLAMIKRAGFNFIRGSHYPQRRTLLELCDKMGLLVWEEAIGWNIKKTDLTDPEFVRVQLDQAGHMTWNSVNHPCVVIRGFLNETDSQFPESRNVIKALYDRIRAVDPHALITYASNKYEKDCCMDLVDIVSMNPYPGWYDSGFKHLSTVDQVAPALDKLAAAMPQEKPLLISEIGAEALYGFRDPLKTYWSEEYQSELLQEVFRYVAASPQFAGVAVWQFADTRSYVNGPDIFGRARGFNNKGMVDEYRRPKSAWHAVTAFLKNKILIPKEEKKP